jgi:phage shock protein E
MIGQIGNLAGYALMGLGVGIVLHRLITQLSARRRIPELLQSGAQIVDVRSPGEFAMGHSSGSLNIPLDDLEREAKELDPNRWVIVCCASGTRSGIARRWLLRHGFSQVLNGGSWRNLP